MIDYRGLASRFRSKHPVGQWIWSPNGKYESRDGVVSTENYPSLLRHLAFGPRKSHCIIIQVKVGHILEPSNHLYFVESNPSGTTFMTEMTTL